MDVLAGFWSGGYEGADHLNAAGEPLDLVRASGHLDNLEEDHARAAEAGFCSVRESIGWRISEDERGAIDLSRAQRVAASARRHGLQVVWTLMHYGVPAGLSLHHDALIERFARFAHAVARVLGTCSERPPVFIPINEISFLSWAASQPHLLHAPHNTVGVDDETIRARGYDVKCRLVRAALMAMRAMKAVEPRCIFLHAEPLIHVVAPKGRPELAELAQTVCDWQWQAWDLLVGVERPELGGWAGSVDVMGLNYYHDSQWELGTGLRLDWHAGDARRRRLSDLMRTAWRRLGKPLMLAETSHVGCGRARWLHEVAGEVDAARSQTIPVAGMCLYPLTDRPDWNETKRWHRSGLWHVAHDHANLPRTVEASYLAALNSWQHFLPIRVDGKPRVVVVICHRPWGLASHRTRQLMEHVAHYWRVVWLEEPRPWNGADCLESRACGPMLELLIPYLAPASCGPHARSGETLSKLVLDHLETAGIKPDAVWLSASGALPLALALQPTCLVYETNIAADVLPPRHKTALYVADVLVAADEACVRACPGATKPVHRIASGVNLFHFFADRDPMGWAAMEARSLQGHLPQPRVGFAGTIDERLDLALIARIARARPSWQFVMLGPLRQLDAACLPLQANITWLGEQPAEILPAIMSQWSLAWLPWRACTAEVDCFPIQVLEYLASGLAVVTPWMKELVPLGAAGVRFVSDDITLLNACELVLTQSAELRSTEQENARQLLQRRSWGSAALKAVALMNAEIDCAKPHPGDLSQKTVEKPENVVRKVA